jgi:murein L,D-transpeptidase YafK
MRAYRRAFILGATAFLAACGSKFRRYNGPEVTRILVFKQDRKMYLMSGSATLKAYDIALGGNPIGHKQFEGDQKTPEGHYKIDGRNPNSSYHLSLRISYPNDDDRAFAKSQGKEPGGDIYIHGRAGANRGRGPDWTAGCISVKDREMEVIYAMVRTGTDIALYP